MSTAEFAQVAPDEQATDLRFAHWLAVRRMAIALYFAALVLWSASNGIPVQRELVILWTCGALLCASIGRHPRQVVQLVLDWLPIVLILVAYDFTRGAADSWGIGTHFLPMIDFDKTVFGGEVPTEWLQAHLYDPEALSAWNVGFTLVYTSYFITPFALAGWFWVHDHPAFLRFRRRLVTLALAGLATYIAFPAAPPWLASEEGLLGPVLRTTGKGWDIIGVGTAGLFSEGQASVNVVAAVPSLHAAFTMLVALAIWPRVRRRRLRPLLLLYPLAMGLTLLACGEHYFFDVALGWIYAGAVLAGWAAWERRRAPVALAAAAESGEAAEGAR
jgi:membrane-associated phospholipid phosphatase